MRPLLTSLPHPLHPPSADRPIQNPSQFARPIIHLFLHLGNIFFRQLLRLQHVLIDLSMLRIKLIDTLVCADYFFLQVADLVLKVVRAWRWGARAVHFRLGVREVGKYAF